MPKEKNAKSLVLRWGFFSKKLLTDKNNYDKIKEMEVTMGIVTEAASAHKWFWGCYCYDALG